MLCMLSRDYVDLLRDYLDLLNDYVSYLGPTKGKNKLT